MTRINVFLDICPYPDKCQQDIWHTRTNVHPDKRPWTTVYLDSPPWINVIIFNSLKNSLTGYNIFLNQDKQVQNLCIDASMHQLNKGKQSGGLLKNMKSLRTFGSCEKV